MGKVLVVAGILLTFLLVGTGIYANFHGHEAVGWVWAGLVVGLVTLGAGSSISNSKCKKKCCKEA